MAGGEADYELYWLVNDMKKEFPRAIKKIKNSLWNRTYHLSTAKVWIDNSRKPYGTRKRKSQLYIQTWHATICLKPIGMWRGELFPEIAYLVSKHDSGLIDYVLSGSDWCSNMYRKGLIYDGDILMTGTPRCDILLHDRRQIRREVRRRFGIAEEASILLYAPTFRGGNQKGAREVSAEETTVDLQGVTEALGRRFGGNWVTFLRLHPQLAAKREGMRLTEGGIVKVDVSQYPDMNELIAASDVFLTDYSSAAFEASLIDMPVFLYVDDLDEYIQGRGTLMFDIAAMPYPVAKTNRSLVKNILQFDKGKYVKKNREFMKTLGIMEDGRASERAAELVKAYMAGAERKHNG